MPKQEQTVFVIDDDFRIRESLSELLASLGLRCVAFESAAQYLAFDRSDCASCLLLDINLPDINGLDFQQQIAQDDHPPIIVITGYGDIPSSVKAIKAGAVDFLTKPFGERDLINAIEAATEKGRVDRQRAAELANLRQRFASLTPRERDVLPLVVSGLLNKQAAAVLGISEVTLQIHRSKIMHKMGVASLAELVRMAARLEIPIVHTRRSVDSHERE